MAFKKYTPVVPVKGPAPVSITIPDKDAKNRPFLMIDQATLKKLGWPADAALELAIGEGEHDGKLRIQPMKGEPTVLRLPSKGGKTKRARVILGRMPCLTDDEFKSPVGFEILGETGGGYRPGADPARRRAVASAAPAHGGRGSRGQQSLFQEVRA